MQIGQHNPTPRHPTCDQFGAAALSQISDQALVESIADGDKRALKLLYVRHNQRVHRFVLRLVAMSHGGGSRQ